jgi:hypothetical protein
MKFDAPTTLRFVRDRAVACEVHSLTVWLQAEVARKVPVLILTHMEPAYPVRRNQATGFAPNEQTAKFLGGQSRPKKRIEPEQRIQGIKVMAWVPLTAASPSPTRSAANTGISVRV